MGISELPEMKDIDGGDVFTIVDHMVYRNGVQIPYLPHEKRAGRATIEPKYFVYHYTAGRYGIDGVTAFLRDKDTQADVHLILDTGGRVVQLAPLNEKCWHAGRSAYEGYTGLNSYSCGIEVINPGPLDIISPGVYKTWYGDVYFNSLIINTKALRDRGYRERVDIVESTHNLYPNEPIKGWIPYSKEQINVMIGLTKTINATYGSKLVGHDEITSRKRDPGPLSQIDRIRGIIASRDDDKADVEEEVTIIQDAPIRRVFHIDTQGAADQPTNSTILHPRELPPLNSGRTLGGFFQRWFKPKR